MWWVSIHLTGITEASGGLFWDIVLHPICHKWYGIYHTLREGEDKVEY